MTGDQMDAEKIGEDIISLIIEKSLIESAEVLSDEPDENGQHPCLIVWNPFANIAIGELVMKLVADETRKNHDNRMMLR